MGCALLNRLHHCNELEPTQLGRRWTRCSSHSRSYTYRRGLGNLSRRTPKQIINMHVKLVAVTQPNPDHTLAKDMTAEDLIVMMARVSSPANQANTETAPNLIRYLIKNKHWSPFDMVNMTVEVKTSKAIAIQILRHWSIKPQEFSQRYAEVTEIEPIQLRKAGATNRQSSEEAFDPVFSFTGYIDYTQEASRCIEEYILQGQELYRNLLDAGVAKECARMILPMATSTVMYLNGSVRSWIHYLEQRTDQHAQLEHREVAAEIKRIFAEQFPNIAKAIEDGRHG